VKPLEPEAQVGGVVALSGEGVVSTESWWMSGVALARMLS